MCNALGAIIVFGSVYLVGIVLSNYIEDSFKLNDKSAHKLIIALAIIAALITGNSSNVTCDDESPSGVVYDGKSISPSAR